MQFSTAITITRGGMIEREHRDLVPEKGHQPQGPDHADHHDEHRENDRLDGPEKDIQEDGAIRMASRTKSCISSWSFLEMSVRM